MPPQKTVGEIRDIDGNVYHSVTIGTQTWMVENLKVTHYRNGDPIPYSSTELTNGAFCNYGNNDSIAAIYGRMYNYASVQDARNICPAGWHLPTEAEWSALENVLGGNNTAGGKLKETGDKHWASPNVAATNSSGFIGLPGGNNGSGNFADLGNYAYFWGDPSSTYSRALLYNYSAISVISNVAPNQFFSARCLKDN